MITQADVNNAQKARDDARALLEAYWSGNPDGNYSVMGWLEELAKCTSTNINIVYRDANLELHINGNALKGGCNAANFSNRLKQFNDRISKYMATWADWKSKSAAYDQLLKDFQLQEQTQTSTVQNQATQAQAAAAVALIEAQIRNKKIMTYAGIGILVFTAGGLIYLLFKSS